MLALLRCALCLGLYNRFRIGEEVLHQAVRRVSKGEEGKDATRSWNELNKQHGRRSINLCTVRMRRCTHIQGRLNRPNFAGHQSFREINLRVPELRQKG